MIPEESIERRLQGAKSRNQTYVLHLSKWDGEHSELEFLDEVRTDAELLASKKFWLNEGYSTSRVYDLYMGESPLARTRRLRNNKSWEGWRQ